LLAMGIGMGGNGNKYVGKMEIGMRYWTGNGNNMGIGNGWE